MTLQFDRFDPDTLSAIDESIRHWKNNATPGKFEGISARKCALCKKFNEDLDCVDSKTNEKCPIYAYTGKTNCENPEYRYANRCYTPEAGQTDNFIEAATEELHFLEKVRQAYVMNVAQEIPETEPKILNSSWVEAALHSPFAIQIMFLVYLSGRVSIVEEPPNMKYKQWLSDTASMIRQGLVDKELLKRDNLFVELTPKGKVYCEALLAMPFPVSHSTIEDNLYSVDLHFIVKA